MSTRLLVLAAALALTAGPALAWEFKSETIDGSRKYFTAWQADDTGKQVLQLECQETFADDPNILLVTAVPYDAGTAYPNASPLGVSVDGHATAGLYSLYVNADGKVGLAAYATEDTGVRPIIDAIRTATQGITVTSPLGDETHYSIADASTAVDSFEKGCESLPN